MSRYDIIQLLGAIGVFMFGMSLFEEALNSLGSERLKQIMKTWTGTTGGSIIAGIVTTALLQSSTLVSLITLGFVSARIMTFRSAFGVILGANIGTTVSGWTVALIGFSIDLQLIVFPLLFVSGLSLLLLSGYKTLRQWMKVVAGFGFLFLGLDLIKTTVSGLADTINLSVYADRGVGGFFLLGIVITLVIQSSSLTKALIMTGLYSSIVSFEQALSMMIGSNLGTTATAVIAALGTNRLKQQVAMSHVLFNAVASVTILLVPRISTLMLEYLQADTNPTLALALFDTVFNTVRVLICIPFIGPCTRRIESIFPVSQTDTPYLAIETLQTPLRENKIQALHHDIDHMRHKVIQFNLWLFGSDYDDESMVHQYERLKTLHNKLLRFVFSIDDLPKKEQEKLTSYINSIQLLMQSAKSLKEVVSYIQEAVHSDHPIISKIYHQTHQKLTSLYDQIQTQPHRFDTAMIRELLGQFRTDDQQFLNDIRSYIKDSHVSEHSMMVITYLHRYSYYSTKALMESIL